MQLEKVKVKFHKISFFEKVSIFHGFVRNDLYSSDTKYVLLSQNWGRRGFQISSKITQQYLFAKLRSAEFTLILTVSQIR